MIMVNIAQAKARLSELLDAAGRGEQVMICNHNRPVAELRPVEGVTATARDLSPLYPDWTIDPAFFEPMGEDELREWYEGEVFPTSSQVAESPASYGARRKKRARGGRR